MENAERVSRKGTGIAGAVEGSGGGRLESKLSIVHMMMVFSLSAFEKMRSPCHITLIILAICYVLEYVWAEKDYQSMTSW